MIEQERKRVWSALHKLDATKGTGSSDVDGEIQRLHGKFHNDPHLGNFRAQNGTVPLPDPEDGFVSVPLFDGGRTPPEIRSSCDDDEESDEQRARLLAEIDTWPDDDEADDDQSDDETELPASGAGGDEGEN